MYMASGIYIYMYMYIGQVLYQISVKYRMIWQFQHLN